MSEKIKVTDKRMFTPEGELREEYVKPEAAEAPGHDAREAAVPDRPSHSRPATVGPEPPSSATEPPPGGAGPARPARFLDLVGMLAEPIAIFLGDAKLPDGRSAEDPELARFHIDLLEILQEKTAGNLDRHEETVLEDLLYQLRLRYVEKGK